MATVNVYAFEAKIASRCYHIYKETSWSMDRDGEEVKVEPETSQSSKKLNDTPVPFVLKRNISKDGRQ